MMGNGKLIPVSFQELEEGMHVIYFYRKTPSTKPLVFKLNVLSIDKANSTVSLKYTEAKEPPQVFTEREFNMNENEFYWNLTDQPTVTKWKLNQLNKINRSRINTTIQNLLKTGTTQGFSKSRYSKKS